MGFCEVVSLAGDAICKIEVSPDTSIQSVKHELQAVTNIPVQLQQLIYHDRVVADDEPCFCDAGCSDHSLLLVILSIPSACTTAEEICKVLCMLTDLGSQALAPHIDDIVSLLGRTFDTAEHNRRGTYWRRNSSEEVHVSALKALASAGDLCLTSCNEMLASMPVFIDKSWADAAMSAILHEGRSWRTSKQSGISLLLKHLRGGGRIINPLSSLLSAIGPEGLLVTMDRFSDAFQSADQSQKEVALVAIGEAMLSFSELPVQCIDWLAVCICDSDLQLLGCSLHYLNLITLKSPDLSMAMEQYVPSMLSRFESLGGRLRFEDNLFLLSAICRLLGNYSHHVVPRMKMIVTVFLAVISEEYAEREIAAFQRHVNKKPHGAYMLYMKNRDSLVAVFSSFFKTLGYECCETILQEYTDLPCNVGPCQKAVLLLSAAQPMPTFTKSQASGCAARFSALLHDVNWQLRMCAIYCLQRLMAGHMGPEPHIHKIAVLLKDIEPFVRQSAATALGCLGRRVARYEKALLSLLKERCYSVRYAVLVTLGGLMALARRHFKTISRHLHDEHPRCRMAALRVLKNSGMTAAPFLEQLQAWRQMWYDASPYICSDKMKKLEPITTRALMFPSVRLNHLFKGHAPLGRAFAGTRTARVVLEKQYELMMSQAAAERMRWIRWCNAGTRTARVALEKQYELKMSQAAAERMRWIRWGNEEDDHDFISGVFESASNLKELREHYRAVQNRYHDRSKNQSRARKQKMAQWHIKLKEGSDAKALLSSSRRLHRCCEKKQHTVGVHAATMDEWVVPTVKPSCCNVDAVDYADIFTLFENE